MKKALVTGAGGFIGGHLVKRLKEEGYWVRGVDIKEHAFDNCPADDFILGDLRDPNIARRVVKGPMDEIYQLAADMGGAGYIFTGDNDAHVMHNSSLCNLNILEAMHLEGGGKIFYSSSACMYPEYNQTDINNPNCSEDSAYPAQPDSEYGWEKLFSERLYLSYHRNYQIDVRIGRFHNIFGPMGTWMGGREKAPAAICRKVAEANENEYIEIWGNGEQTRSFLFIDECIEAVRRLMQSSYQQPVNIGFDQMININDLAQMVIEISRKNLQIKHIEGPLGVKSRNSDNRLIQKVLGWAPSQDLKEGMVQTYHWVNEQALAQLKVN